MLFESIGNNRFFENSPMFLCFTKYDLFEANTVSGKSSLNVAIPEYTGSTTDVVACRDYITMKFTNVLQTRRDLGIFYLNATDTEDVRGVVEVVLGGQSSRPHYLRFDDKRSDSPIMQDNGV